MYVTTLHLDTGNDAARRETRDLCAMHSRIIDATTGMPDDGPRTLWAHPQPGMLIIRAAEPVTEARLPAGYALHVSHRPWQPPDRPGSYRMVAVLNPGRHHTEGGPTVGQPDRKRIQGRPRLVHNPDDQAAWLTRRLCATVDSTVGGVDPVDAARIDTYRVSRTWTATGQHRTGSRVTVRLVAVAATITVTDPTRVHASIVGGIGIDKTWGAGLTMWQRAE